MALRNRITEAIRDRTAPLCLNCLTRGLVEGPPDKPPQPDFDSVVKASQEVALRRSYGECPDCTSHGILLHPPT